MYLCTPKSIGKLVSNDLGVWRSPVSAPALGAGGHKFESCYPDDQKKEVLSRAEFPFDASARSPFDKFSGCSAARLARQLRELEVPSSNLGIPTNFLSEPLSDQWLFCLLFFHRIIRRFYRQIEYFPSENLEKSRGGEFVRFNSEAGKPESRKTGATIIFYGKSISSNLFRNRRFVLASFPRCDCRHKRCECTGIAHVGPSERQRLGGDGAQKTHDRILFQPGLLVRLQCGNFRRHQHRRFLDQDFPQRLQKRPSRIQSRLQSAQTDRSTQQTPFVALYDDGRQRDDLLFQLKMGILFGNETKKCPECGMIIPSEARKCPYCRTEFGEPSLSDDLNRFGCLGYPLVILTILLLLHTCS